MEMDSNKRPEYSGFGEIQKKRKKGTGSNQICNLVNKILDV